MFQNETNELGRNEILPIENLLDDILDVLFISYVTRKLRVLRETGPWILIIHWVTQGQGHIPVNVT